MKIINFTMSRIHSIIGVYSMFGIPFIVLFKDYAKDFKNAKTIHL